MNITESFLRGKIAETITANETVPFTKKVSKVPTLTKGFITVSPDTDNEEIFFYEGTSWTTWTTWTITITWRWYNKENNTQLAANQKWHTINDIFKWALNHIIINEKVDKTDLASTLNWEWASTVWIEDSWNNFVSTNVEWALNELAQWAPWVANASTTVAGKVELATQAEFNTKATTWWAWPLVPQSDTIIGWAKYIWIPWEIRLWTTSIAPDSWLIADWAAISRTTYATLFWVIGTTYWAWDWITTFNIPDLRGNVPVWQNTWTFNTLWWAGWEETHTLTEAEIPWHTHTLSYFKSWYSSWTGIQTVTWTNPWVFSTTWTTWWWASHNNLQPYLVINYIIKF